MPPGCRSKPRPSCSRIPARNLSRIPNTPAAPINLKVLLPFKIFADKTGVSRIVAETREGSFGLLLHRLDCVGAALSAAGSTYEQHQTAKYSWPQTKGCRQDRSRRTRIRAPGDGGHGSSANCAKRWSESFPTLDEQEQSVRSVLAKMEGDLIRRMANLHND